jgi:pentose-5-phosphate-3-epimerase
MSLPKIAPSILAADFLNLHGQVQAAERGGIDLQTIRPAYQSGARVFVAGTSVFRDAAGPRAGVQRLMKAAQQD